VVSLTCTIQLIILGWVCKIAEIATFHLANLNTSTFMIYMVTTWSQLLLSNTVLSSLETVVSVREHLSCEGLGHDGLASLSGNLSKVARASTKTGVGMIACRVRCIWLLYVAIRRDCVIQAHCSVVDVSSVLHLPLRYLALERLGIETSWTLEGSSRVLVVVNSLFLLARVESMIHICDVLLDAYSFCCTVIILSIDLSG